MNKDSKQTAFPAGDFISEDAVRGAFGRRRTPARTNNSPTGLRGDTRAATDRVSSSARLTAPLRRWSVADLIARAIAPAAGSGIRH
jgi:hypothetical protein